MRHTTTVVVGAGHCGLAMSRCLAERSVDHVVLERGEVAHSLAHPAVGLAAPAHPELDDPAAGLRLPRRRPGRLPRRAGGGPAARGLRAESAAPVLTGTTVTSVRPDGAGLPGAHRPGQLARADRRGGDRRDRGRRRARPAGAAGPPGITTVTAADYRNPGRLPDGGVLVVGASASGVQIAEELHRSGRPVTLAVGEHVRMPRTYRGRDILWWMDASGLLDERWDAVPDLVRARATCRRCSSSASPQRRPST